MLDYYAVNNVRNLCHKLKNGDPGAILTIAQALSTQISKGDLIIPMPNRHGVAGVMGDVCTEIQLLTSCGMWDGLRGDPRESIYEAKKNGNPLSVNLTLAAPLPSTHGRCFVVDGIIDTGTTMNAALKLLPGAHACSFAKVDKAAELEAESISASLGKHNFEGVFRDLARAKATPTAFSLVRVLIRDNPELSGHIINAARQGFGASHHQGFVDGFLGGFTGNLMLPDLRLKDKALPTLLLQTPDINLDVRIAASHFRR
jgi:hypothetical protein